MISSVQRARRGKQMSPILLDTHAAIWATTGKLARSAVVAIDAAAERRELLLSPISAWEIGTLVQKRRLRLFVTVDNYIRALFTRPGLLTATLTPAIAVAASTLPGNFQGDPADRIMIATAAAYAARLMTRDKAIHAYGKATKHVQTVEC